MRCKPQLRLRLVFHMVISVWFEHHINPSSVDCYRMGEGLTTPVKARSGNSPKLAPHLISSIDSELEYTINSTIVLHRVADVPNTD